MGPVTEVRLLDTQDPAPNNNLFALVDFLIRDLLINRNRKAVV